MKIRRILVTALLSLICGIVFSQIYTPVTPTIYGSKDNRRSIDSTLFYPTGCGSPILHSFDLKKSAVYFDSCNHRFWIYDPKRSDWDSAHLGVGGGGGTLFGVNDTIFIGNRYANQAGYELVLRNGTLRVGGTQDVGVRFAYDFTQTPLGPQWSSSGSTITASGGKTRMNGTINLTAIENGTFLWTGVPKWHTTFTIITRVKSSSTQKVAFALIPPITASAVTRKIEFNLTQDSGYFNYFANSAGTIPDRTSKGQTYLNWAAMDTFDVTLKFDNGIVTAEGRNRINGQRANFYYNLGLPQGNVSELVIYNTGDFDWIGDLKYYIDQPKFPLFLCTGNSTTVGVGAGASSYANTWPSQLFSRYDNIYEVAAGATERVEQSILRKTEIRNFIKPANVLYDYGINSLLNSLPSPQFGDSVSKFVRLMLDSNIQTILIAVPPQAVNNTVYNDSLQAIAGRYGLIYVDISTPLKGASGGNDRDSHFNFDGVHYNDIGYELWASVVEKKIQPLLYSRPTFINDRVRVMNNYSFAAFINSRGETVAVPDGINPKYIFSLPTWVGGISTLQPNANIGIDGDLRMSGEFKVYIPSTGASESNPNLAVLKSDGYTHISGWKIGFTVSPPIFTDVNGLNFDRGSSTMGKIFMSGGSSTDENIWMYNRKLRIKRTQGDGGTNNIGVEIVNDPGTVPPDDYRPFQSTLNNGTTEKATFYITKKGFIYADTIPHHATPDSIVAWKDGFLKAVTVTELSALVGGGGISMNNTNVGSSFPLLNVGTQAIKTLAAGTGITLDTSTTGTITITASGGGGGVSQSVITDTLQNYWRKTGNNATSGYSTGSFIGTINNVSLPFKSNGTLGMVLDSIQRLITMGRILVNNATDDPNYGMIVRGTTDGGNQIMKLCSNNGSACALIGWNELTFPSSVRMLTPGIFEFGTTGGAADAILYTGNNDRIHILAAGNVGVGVSAPRENLDVNGKLSLRTVSAGSSTDSIGAVENGRLTAITAAQIVAAANISSGTYTPTLTNVTNVSSSIAYVCQYMRVGSTVTVSGIVDVSFTTALLATELGISLPIASSLTNDIQCAGVGASESNREAYVFIGDSANDRASISSSSASTGSRVIYFTFTYQIL